MSWQRALIVGRDAFIHLDFAGLLLDQVLGALFPSSNLHIIFTP